MPGDKNKNIYVCRLDSKKILQLQNDLKTKNFEFYDVDHALFGARQKKLNIVLYKSKKLVIQGKKAREFVEFYLEPYVLKDFSLTYNSFIKKQSYKDHIGVDESGKGDYFGPLVIASAYVQKKQIDDLLEIGIKDSKKISDKKAIELYNFLRQKTKYSIVTIGPERYNSLYEKMSNLNRILAWGHARAIENLLLKVTCPLVMVDKFGKTNLISEALMKRGSKVTVTQKHRAEEDIVVAAASILARGEFLLRLNQLEEEYSISLPRGAGKAVEQAAVNLMNSQGMSVLTKVAKLHFKTTKKIILP